MLAALALAAVVLLPSCGDSGSSLEDFVEQNANNPLPEGPAPVLAFEVVNTYPHDTDAFTQGLLFSNGRLFESSGLTGQSNLREVDLITGDVLRQVDNDPTQFAEGLALRAGRLYQLTLGSGVTNVWNQGNFALETTIPTRSPAWGLAYIADGDRFVFSDGTSTLRYLLPTSFQEVGSVVVTDDGVEVDALNELEYVNGVILANRFLTDEIVGIDPTTGVVLFRADLTGIIDKQAEGLGFNDVLNGIAYDPGQDRLFVTGKRWPFLYQIRILAP
jgi:glutamine cyclotransferase